MLFFLIQKGYKNKNLKGNTLAALPSGTLLLGVREEPGLCAQVEEPMLCMWVTDAVFERRLLLAHMHLTESGASRCWASLDPLGHSCCEAWERVELGVHCPRFI